MTLRVVSAREIVVLSGSPPSRSRSVRQLSTVERRESNLHKLARISIKFCMPSMQSLKLHGMLKGHVMSLNTVKSRSDPHDSDNYHDTIVPRWSSHSPTISSLTWLSIKHAWVFDLGKSCICSWVDRVQCQVNMDEFPCPRAQVTAQSGEWLKRAIIRVEIAHTTTALRPHLCVLRGHNIHQYAAGHDVWQSQWRGTFYNGFSYRWEESLVIFSFWLCSYLHMKRNIYWCFKVSEPQFLQILQLVKGDIEKHGESTCLGLDVTCKLFSTIFTQRICRFIFASSLLVQ